MQCFIDKARTDAEKLIAKREELQRLIEWDPGLLERDRARAVRHVKRRREAARERWGEMSPERSI